MDLPEKTTGTTLPELRTDEILFDVGKFEHLQRIAKLFSESQLVPEHFRKNMPNCFIALHMAVRLRADPFMVMQNIYVLHGKVGMEAKLAIALINTRGPYENGIQFEYSGQGMTRACKAWGKRKDTGSIDTCVVDMVIAKKEGWLDKPGSKWQTIADQMLAYRSASWLGRLYCPECLMGMQTVEELKDVGPDIVVEAPKSLKDALHKTKEKFKESEEAEVTNVAEPEPVVAPLNGKNTEAPLPTVDQTGQVLGIPEDKSKKKYLSERPWWKDPREDP